MASFEEVESKRATLKSGDYTISGYETEIICERKSCVSEIVKNCTGKDYQRFQRELIRLQSFKEKYVILEFSLQNLLDYPKNCGIPVYKIPFIKRIGQSILKQIETMEVKYNIPFIFAQNRFDAQEIVLDIFRKFLEGKNDKTQNQN
jgi:hypothetical protein